MSETRSRKITGQVAPSFYRRLRAVAFLHGWTLSKALSLVIERGLPLLEAEVSQADRRAWAEVIQGVSDA